MKRKERITHWQGVVDGIVTDYRRLDNACNAAISAGALDPNGPLHEAIWRMFDGMLQLTDVAGWINWFIYETNCGKKPKKVSGTRLVRTIRTTRQVAVLIVESEEAR